MKNKKRILLALFIFCCFIYVAFCLSGCGQDFAEAHYTVNKVESTTPVTHNMFGIDALVEIPVGEGLYYDFTTGIVYWWNGSLGIYNHSSTPTPYYSPNGLLYRYIPETNMLEEIKPYSMSMKGEK